MTPSIIAVLIVGALAVFSAERQVRALHVATKPLATALLLLVVGVPATRLAWWVDVGIVLSMVGDVALLWPSNGAFIAGLAAFLLAHVAYVVGFLGGAVAAPQVAVVAVVIVAVTAFILRAIWAGAAGLRGPTVAYGVVISAMVVTAAATLGGPFARAPWAAAGAVLFYASDASLALNRFRRPIPHAHFLTMGLYWLGQLGIALAARAG